MSETNVALAPSVSNKEAFANHYLIKGLQPYQISYLILGENKKLIQETLVKKEVEAQSILLNLVEGENKTLKQNLKIKEVEDALISYKAVVSEMTDKYRLPFTNFLKANVIDPLMEYEKRADSKTNSLFQTINTALIDMKRKEAEQSANNAKKVEEAARYLAHAKNEVLRVKTEYQTSVKEEIGKMYAFWLENKIEQPEINTLKEAIKSIKLGTKIIMKRQYLSDDEARAKVIGWIANEEFVDVSLSELQDAALKEVDAKFSMYASDLAVVKSKPGIVKEIKQHAEQEVQQLQEQAKTETQVNDLVSHSAPILSFKSEYKQLKTSQKVVLENSPVFARRLMSIYIQTPELDEYITLKEWKNLKVEQIANAIGKYVTEYPEKKFPSIQYETEQK